MLAVILYGIATIATAMLLSALIVTPFVVAWEAWKAKRAKKTRYTR